MVLDGVMILWFAEVLISVVFVAVDIVRTPESPVLKWGFVIVTLFMGPIGLTLYILSCREPIPGTHAEYVRPRWRQVVGSTMHCVAGDGIGILVAAAVLAPVGLPEWVNLSAEYALGFLFGWTIFQALFMKDMAGGDYGRSLRMTVLPEFVSMNGLMAGMIALSVPWRQSLGELGAPSHPEFWFVLSLSLTLGFAVTFPVNWWLVSAALKHGMMTVQPGGTRAPLTAGLVLAGSAMSASGSAEHAGHGADSMPAMKMPATRERRAPKAWMITVSLLLLAAGVLIAGTLGSLTAR